MVSMEEMVLMVSRVALELLVEMVGTAAMVEQELQEMVELAQLD